LKKKISDKEKRRDAQIARRKNITKIKPSGKIYKRNKRVNNSVDE
tara:strand:- start:1555 stop:1689 length:135 start_codon:yes stop_codon:yes gene_type:complete